MLLIFSLFFQESIISITLLYLAGAVLLLLWSTHFVNKSITNAFGGRLRRFISNSTDNRFKAFTTGFGITALLQSSTATTLMAASFIEKNMINLSAAIAIVIGADLSTTIIAQLLIFDVSWLSPAFLVIGGWLSLRKTTNAKVKAAGDSFIGLGLILLALSLIREASEPLKHSLILEDILSALKNDAFMAVTVSAILTLLIHSSLATVLFYAALVGQGIVSIDVAYLLVIGANIGGALIPYMATYRDGIDKQRLMLVNIFMRLSIAILALSFIHPIQDFIHTHIGTDAGRAVVIIHTAYNAALALIFLPLVPLLNTLAHRYIQKPADNATASTETHLDTSLLDRPVLALSGAMRETLLMADLIEDMTDMAFRALKDNNEDLLHLAQISEKAMDRLFKKVTHYLTRLDLNDLTSQERKHYDIILNYATNLEHSGDIVQHSLTQAILKKIEAQENFSDEGWNEICEFYNAVFANIKTSQSLFISQSQDIAEDVIHAKKALKQVEMISRRNHFGRISDNNPHSILTSGIHIDIMRDLGRINSHVSGIAYQILDTAAQENKG